MIPGVELTAERRLLFLWLFFVIGLGMIYYMKPNPTLLQRFERAYYSTYWNRPVRPISATQWPKDNPSVGFITPTYISTLVDTELWVSIRNTSTTNTITPTLVISETVRITPNPKDGDQALEQRVDAQILLREGENRIDLNPNSHHAIEFGPIRPQEMSTRLVWARILPVASNPNQGDEPVYIFDENLQSGTVMFSFYLLNPDGSLPDDPLYAQQEPSKIDTRQSVTRGFIRTLLLPPWANGLLVGLGLILAFVTSSSVSLIEERLRARGKKAGGKKTAGNSTT